MHVHMQTSVLIAILHDVLHFYDLFLFFFSSASEQNLFSIVPRIGG